jgi:hypothetical protein
MVFIVDDTTSSTDLWGADPSTGDVTRLARVSGADELTPVGNRVLLKSGLTDPGPLWVTDGTPEGTRELGSTSDPQGALQVGERTLFWSRGSAPERDLDLWATDGTRQGTRRLETFQDISRPPLVVSGDLAFFLPLGGGSTCMLWSTDGTPDGTKRLFVPPDAVDLAGRAPTCQLREGPDGEMVITAPLDSAWLTDGTEAGTTRADHLSGGTGYTSVGAKVFFSRGDTLWVSDGSEGGTAEVTTFDVQAIPAGLMFDVDGSLVFSPNGHDLWRSDGTVDGTSEIETSPNALMYPRQVGDDGRVYFVIGDAIIARTDGTASGTGQLVVTEDTGSATPAYDVSGEGLAYVSGDEVELLPRGATDPTRLWPPDGFVATASSNPRLFHSVGDTVFFQATREGMSDSGMWKTNGTPEGTMPVDGLSTGIRFLGSLDDSTELVVRDSEYLTMFDADPATLQPLDDARDVPDMDVLVSSHLVPGASTPYLIEVAYDPSSMDNPHIWRIARIDGRNIVGLARVALSPEEEDVSGFSTWVDEREQLVIVSEGCRRWAFAPDGEAVARNEAAQPCLRARPVRFGTVTLEVDDQGLWRRSEGADRVSLHHGEIYREGKYARVPVVIADRAYFVVEVDRKAQLWMTDGTPDGTMPISEDLEVGPQQEAGIVRAGDAILFSAYGSPTALYGYRANEGLFPLTPDDGGDDGRLDWSNRTPLFASAGDRLVYPGFSGETGVEPFAVDFEIRQPPVRGGGDADAGTPDGQMGADTANPPVPSAKEANGCSCVTAPRRAADFWLFALLGVLVPALWCARTAPKVSEVI